MSEANDSSKPEKQSKDGSGSKDEGFMRGIRNKLRRGKSRRGKSVDTSSSSSDEQKESSPPHKAASTVSRAAPKDSLGSVRGATRPKSAAAGEPFRVKFVNASGDATMVDVHPAEKFDSLVHKVADKLRMSQHGQYVLIYKDPDSQEIGVACTDNMHEMFRLFEPGSRFQLKIVQFHGNNSSAIDNVAGIWGSSHTPSQFQSLVADEYDSDDSESSLDLTNIKLESLKQEEAKKEDAVKPKPKMQEMQEKPKVNSHSGTIEQLTDHAMAVASASAVAAAAKADHKVDEVVEVAEEIEETVVEAASSVGAKVDEVTTAAVEEVTTKVNKAKAKAEQKYDKIKTEMVNEVQEEMYEYKVTINAKKTTKPPQTPHDRIEEAVETAIGVHESKSGKEVVEVVTTTVVKRPDSAQSTGSESLEAAIKKLQETMATITQSMVQMGEEQRLAMNVLRAELLETSKKKEKKDESTTKIEVDVKTESKADEKADEKTEIKVETKIEEKTEVKAETKTETKVETTTETKTETTIEEVAEEKADIETISIDIFDNKPESKSETKVDVDVKVDEKKDSKAEEKIDVDVKVDTKTDEKKSEKIEVDVDVKADEKKDGKTAEKVDVDVKVSNKKDDKKEEGVHVKLDVEEKPKKEEVLVEEKVEVKVEESVVKKKKPDEEVIKIDITGSAHHGAVHVDNLSSGFFVTTDPYNNGFFQQGFAETGMPLSFSRPRFMMSPFTPSIGYSVEDFKFKFGNPGDFPSKALCMGETVACPHCLRVKIKEMGYDCSEAHLASLLNVYNGDARRVIEFVTR